MVSFKVSAFLHSWSHDVSHDLHPPMAHWSQDVSHETFLALSYLCRSFGIALWEVFSFAQWPYEDLTNEEVIQTLKSTGQCSLENPFRPREPLAPM